MAVFQESKLTLNYRTPNIQNFTTVRKDYHQGQGGDLLTLIHKSINFSQRPDSPDTLAYPHLEEDYYSQSGKHRLEHYQVYIPPASSCTGGYNPSLDHLMTTDTIILGDFNAHHSSWYSSSTESRVTMLESMVSGTNFGILNWDSPTRLLGNANPSSPPDVSLASASLITSTNLQTKTNLGSDHLPILSSLQMNVTSNPIQHRSSINLKTGTDTVERLKTS